MSSPEDTQLERLMKRDGSTREDALSRLKSQLPIADKVRYADIVLENSGSQEELERNVELFLEEVRMSVGWTWRLKWLIPPLGIIAAAWTLLRRWVRRSLRAGKFKKQD
jgi:dephospho-CoA kinase